MLTSEQCPWTIFCMVCVAVIVFVQFEIIILAHWGTVSDGEHQTHTLDVGLTHVRKRNTTVLKTMAQYINQSGSAWLKHNYTTSIPTCFDIPPNLVGNLSVNTVEPESWDEIDSLYPQLSAGGRWWPSHCRARHRVAIIVPYRDREAHLKIFLRHIHSYVQAQQIEYAIFVVEQATDVVFNKAMMMNIGFREAVRLGQFDCAIFHDVDMLPENDRNMYSCPQSPRHLGAYVDKFNYRLAYEKLVGGVLAMPVKDFRLVNGFSNSYYGWGGEDDDMYQRIKSKHLRIVRYPSCIGRYKMLVHEHDTRNPTNSKRYHGLRFTARKYDKDGLGSLDYSLRTIKHMRLFTWIFADIPPPKFFKEEKQKEKRKEKKVTLGPKVHKMQV